MDTATSRYYQENAKKLAYRYEEAGEGIALYFAQSFLRGSKVLDIGCGMGRDLNALMKSKMDALGVDSSSAMLDELRSKFSMLSDRVWMDGLPFLKSVADNDYDGVLCSAVLMHIEEQHLFDAAFTIRRILRTGGTFLMSVPGPDLTVDAKTNRDTKGRLFNGVTPEKYQFIFERLGFKLINRWHNEDGLKRSHRTWYILLFRLESSNGTRSLDAIEGVLNKDKKVATYKPALFRALAELAVTNYNLAEWKPGGQVLLPISAVSAKWVEYYWPIFSSETLIPQIQAEAQGGRPIAFRQMMMLLIQQFKNQGELAGFIAASRNQSLPPNTQKIYRSLISKLNTTIKEGPVTHSGGVDSNQTVFQYDKDTKSILISADMWKELSMMGPWIQDATVLRWAELTSKLSKGTIRESQVLDCLLQRPLPDRDVYDARKFYLELSDAHCVWSEVSINEKNLAVDHAIPYALWRNNNLWNLLPSEKKVNGQKSDKLPTHQLIQRRKDNIIHNWEMMRQRHPVRFEHEAIGLSGRAISFQRDNWQTLLFASFSESVEVTAMQRGIERWQPDTPEVVGLIQKNTSVGTIKTSTSKNNLSSFVNKEGDEFLTPETQIFSFEEIKRTNAESKALPLIGSIAAGSPFSGFNTETLLMNPHETDWLKVPSSYWGKNRFIIQVAGDSMEPEIRMGDYLICEYHRHQQLNHSIVIMADFTYLDTGEEAVKRISETPTHWIFSSDNSKYDDIHISKLDTGEFPILGTVLYNLTHQQKIR